MSVINTNITSMIGQQNLGRSQNSLTTAMERLSSGLRINSAKDDAAGQAIANRMSSQITGLSQAQRNANDGISVAQTAEGALNQINDNLQRVRELTVQAQNGTNSAEDKQSIQDEITQRLDEIDRISKETTFNGTQVLASDQTIDIQVGAKDGETIGIELEHINAEQLGLGSFSVGGLTEVSEFSNTTSGVTTTANVSFSQATGTEGTDALAATDLADLKLHSYKAADGTTDVYAIEDTDGSMIKVDGTNITLDEATGVVEFADGFTDAMLTSQKDAYQTDVDSKLASTENPLDALDNALSTVDKLRSDLGAVQNRFDSAITNLSTTETNLSAARSRIEDADYATEVANMTRAQILQQAGTSVLAQANQVPQGVLSLLQ